MTAAIHADDVGVIFDMDGVLVDSAGAHLQSWQLVGREMGRSVAPDDFSKTFGRQNRDIIPLLFGSMSDERSRAVADRKEEIYRDLVRENPGIVPGAVELVQSLRHVGARLAVGSSGPPENIALIVEAMSARDCFSVFVSGDDVFRGKPDPEVFQLAASRLKLSPRQCVVIEDAPAGVTAARAAGTRVVAVLMHHPADAFPHADVIVNRLSDLETDVILSLVGGAGLL